jgi:hypothetical protein
VSSSVSATLYRRLVLNPPLIPSHSRSCVISVLTSQYDINESITALETSIASKMNISQDVAWFAVRKRAHGDHVMIQRARLSAIRAGLSRCAHPGLFSGPADAEVCESHTQKRHTLLFAHDALCFARPGLKGCHRLREVFKSSKTLIKITCCTPSTNRLAQSSLMEAYRG